jgi:hypothetical protein
MGTRFRPADPAAVRERFAAIRARALDRVEAEERLLMAKLASERWTERELADATSPPPHRVVLEATPVHDERGGAGVRLLSDPPDAGHD